MPETALSPLAVYSARPTVRINTQEYPLVSELVVAMEMTEQEGGMSALELRLSNIASDSNGGAAFAFEDDRILKLGATIALYGGDETAPQEIFQGKITGLEIDFPESGAPELVVLAEDVFQQARMARRTQVYNNVTIASLAQQFASRFNLTPVITGFSNNIGTQVQLNESDLAFLRRVFAHYDGDLQVVGRELHISPRSEVRRNRIELELNGQLRRARILADLSQQVTSVTVTGWNPNQGQRVQANSRGSHLSLGFGKTGAQVLSQVLGDRPHHISHLAVSTTEEAEAIANTAFDARARQFLVVEGTADGNPALRVGSHVVLRGLGDRFDNTYYVRRTCHRYGQRGYETDFEAECAYWGGN